MTLRFFQSGAQLARSPGWMHVLIASQYIGDEFNSFIHD
jgi:hypothetical protein